MLNKSTILREIEKTFFYEKRYKKEEISYIHPNYPDYEGTTIAKHFEGKANEELVKGHFEGQLLDSAGLSFINPKPLAYFLGSYLYLSVILIENHDDRTHIPQSTIYHLAEINRLGEKPDIEYEEFVSSMSAQQKKVVINFIEFFSSHHNKHFPIVDFESAYLRWCDYLADSRPE